MYAVVKLVNRTEECSNAGGEHDTFALDEAKPRMLHAGGHMEHLKLDATYYVAEVTFGDNQPRDPGWCLDQLPRYAGEVVRFEPAADSAAARKRLAEVVKHGMPKR